MTSSSVGIELGEMPALPVVAGRFYNNIVYSGVGNDRYAVRERGANVDPDVFEANALSVHPDFAAEAALYRDEGSANLTDAAMVNALAGAVDNLEDACYETAPAVDGDVDLGGGALTATSGRFGIGGDWNDA